MAAATAYMHMDSTHSSSSVGSTISPAPWHLAVPVDTHHHQEQHHQAFLSFDRDLAAPSPSSPPRPRNNSNHHQQLRPGAARRPSSRRRPRPSRKVPTTYITADPASFRRMVHQVTGADFLPPPLALTPPSTHEATTYLCRPAAPTRFVVAAAGALPTLDTSALLLGSGGGSGSTRRTTTAGPAASVRPQPTAASEVDVGAGGVCHGGGSDWDAGVGLGGSGYGGGSDCGAGSGGFPTLESWDTLLY